MKKMILFGMLPALAACNTLPQTKPVRATADLMQGKQNVGSLSLTQMGNDVEMKLSVSGLSTGEYGMHIHAVGKCEGPDYKSSGMHWNPMGKQHGLRNPMGTHAGDLENLSVSGGISVQKTQLLQGIKIMGEGGLLDADGASFIIHAKPDDNVTDPSGNSGDRKICGVVEFKTVP